MKKKGFTLIELLVVIAIIGILSAIVLASLSLAKSKAKDATIQGQISDMRAAAEIYFGWNGNSYNTSGLAVADCASGMFVDTSASSNIAGLITATKNAVGSGNMDCGITADGVAWSVTAQLPSTVVSPFSYFCADSTGKAASYTSTAIQGAAGSPHDSVGGTHCQ
ncbi:MAG: type II secretion system protein [Candidatus Pacebacteria bacterium]|nr:type II secretion system protein [Candidatus Paceibacterota bacterium]